MNIIYFFKHSRLFGSSGLLMHDFSGALDGSFLDAYLNHHPHESWCICVLLCIDPNPPLCILEFMSALFAHCLFLKMSPPVCTEEDTWQYLWEAGWLLAGYSEEMPGWRGDSHGLPREETPEQSRTAFMSLSQSKKCMANKLSGRIDFSHFLTARLALPGNPLVHRSNTGKKWIGHALINSWQWKKNPVAKQCHF